MGYFSNFVESMFTNYGMYSGGESALVLVFLLVGAVLFFFFGEFLTREKSDMD